MIKQLLISFSLIVLATQTPALVNDDWVEAFYAAADQKERQTIIDSTDISPYSFDELYRLLARAPSKSQDVPTGLIKTFRKDEQNRKFYYALDIPDNYDAQKPYPVVIYLHGLASRKKANRNQTVWQNHEQLENDEFIQVFPTAWDKAKWWTEIQSDNLKDIITQVKASYHIDTNKVFLVGISDGGTGCYYMAATSPSQIAGVASVIGFPGVLKDNRARSSENVYPINMRAIKIKSFNTKNDSLYRLDQVKEYIDSFRDIGVDIELIAYPDGGHDLKAFTRSLPQITEFISTTSRDNYPDKITWQYEDKSSLNRVNWLVIHELKPRQRKQGPGSLPGMNRTDKHSGLIELVKQENTIIIKNYGVKSFTLLLSPDHFDFDQDITFIENDKVIHSGRINSNKKTLLDYAVKDFDPNRLYAAEIYITASK